MAAKQTKDQQQTGFQHERQGVFAMQAASSSPVHKDRGCGRARHKRQQRAQACRYECHLAQHDIVRKRGDDAGHVRGVLFYCEVATGVGRAGDKRQEEGEMPVGLLASFFSGESAKI